MPAAERHPRWRGRGVRERRSGPSWRALHGSGRRSPMVSEPGSSAEPYAAPEIKQGIVLPRLDAATDVERLSPLALSILDAVAVPPLRRTRRPPRRRGHPGPGPATRTPGDGLPGGRGDRGRRTRPSRPPRPHPTGRSTRHRAPRTRVNPLARALPRPDRHPTLGDGHRPTTWSASTSVKPYLDTSMINAEAKPTSVWVRRPALFCRISRSSPIAADSASAIRSSPIWGQPWPVGSPKAAITRSRLRPKWTFLRAAPRVSAGSARVPGRRS